MPWQGQFAFGDGWAVYAGTSDQQAPHAHAALQLVVALKGKVVVESAQGRSSAPGLIIAPRVRHMTLPLAAPLTFLYADVHAPLGRHLLSCVAARVIAPASRSAVTALRTFDFERPSLGRLVPAGLPARPMDARLALAIDRLDREAIKPGAIACVAKKAGLSPARLRAIAGAELGIPLVQWIVWRKLARASTAIVEGRSLAEAALFGGFADQAHFSRVMKQMFGVTPGQASAPLRSVRKR